MSERNPKRVQQFTQISVPHQINVSKDMVSSIALKNKSTKQILYYTYKNISG